MLWFFVGAAIGVVVFAAAAWFLINFKGWS